MKGITFNSRNAHSDTSIAHKLTMSWKIQHLLLRQKPAQNFGQNSAIVKAVISFHLILPIVTIFPANSSDPD